MLVVALVVVAALSLLVPWSLAFDPQAWVVWGRDAGRLALDTDSGPSWKPLPVLITTPLSATGDGAPALWLLFARTGALLALAGAAALGARLGGMVAGVAAAGVMAVGPWWGYNAALGNSEGLLAAALLWAAVAHLAGRRRAALALLTAAALLRPEVWPFFAAYAIWAWRTDRGARVAVAAAAIGVPLLWLGPDALGIGGAVRASSAARGEPSPGSAGLEDVPGLAVLADAATLLTIPAALAAVLGAVAGPGPARVLAAAAATWIAMVAVMAQAGYAGNPRYLVAAIAIASVLAGVGAARLARAFGRGRSSAGSAAAGGDVGGAAHGDRRSAGSAAAGGHVGGAARGDRRVPAAAGGVGSAAGRDDRILGPAADGGAIRPGVGAAAAAVLIAAAAAVSLPDLRDQAREVEVRADRRAALPGLIASAGGREAILGCARVRTADDMRPLVAWQLDLPMLDLDVQPLKPAVVLRWRPHYAGPVEPVMRPAQRGFRLLARAPGWEAWAACGRAPQSDR